MKHEGPLKMYNSITVLVYEIIDRFDRTKKRNTDLIQCFVLFDHRPKLFSLPPKRTLEINRAYLILLSQRTGKIFYR